jgi:hypothetical protein
MSSIDYRTANKQIALQKDNHEIYFTRTFYSIRERFLKVQRNYSRNLVSRSIGMLATTSVFKETIANSSYKFSTTKNLLKT